MNSKVDKSKDMRQITQLQIEVTNIDIKYKQVQIKITIEDRPIEISDLVSEVFKYF